MSFCLTLAVVLSGLVASRASETRSESRPKSRPGQYFVGQGIELQIRVIGHGKPPKIDLPAIAAHRHG